MVYAFFATRIRPQKHYLTKARYTFSKHPIAVGNTGPCRPISLRSIRALVALFRYAQYGLLSPYFAALNTGSCYAIAPTRGAIRSAAPAMCSGYALARIRLRNSPYCRWQYGLLSPYFAALNTGFCRPISLRSIRALATLLPPRGGQYAPPLRLCARATPLRAYAYATRPIAVGNTGFCRPISLRSIRAPHRPISLRSIRALATLLPRVGGNTLRRSGYVLAAPPLARIRLRNSPYCPWQYGPKYNKSSNPH